MFLFVCQSNAHVYRSSNAICHFDIDSIADMILPDKVVSQDCYHITAKMLPGHKNIHNHHVAPDTFSVQDYSNDSRYRFRVASFVQCRFRIVSNLRVLNVFHYPGNQTRK